MGAKLTISIYSDKELSFWVDNDQILNMSCKLSGRPKEVFVREYKEEINNCINKLKRHEARN